MFGGSGMVICFELFNYAVVALHVSLWAHPFNPWVIYPRRIFPNDLFRCMRMCHCYPCSVIRHIDDALCAMVGESARAIYFTMSSDNTAMQYVCIGPSVTLLRGESQVNKCNSVHNI